jgi:hypothetical protein
VGIDPDNQENLMASRVARAESPVRSDPVRLLYAAAALLLLVLMLLGFQQFYLHGRAYPAQPLAPPIRTLLIAHGAAMTLWVVAFVVQSLLIVGGNRRLHMAVGPFVVALAVAMVLLGLWLPIQSTRFEPDVAVWNLNRAHFMAIPLFAILTFGAFVAVGIRQRRRPEIHRPMMLLATLSIIPAATDRITGLPDFYAASTWGAWFGPFLTALIIGTLFLVAKSLLTRSFDRWFATGFAVLIVVDVFIMRLAPTDAWGQFAAFLVR